MTESNRKAALRNLDVGTASTWRAAGLSEAELAALVRSGELVKIRYGTYATARILAAAEADPRLAHAVRAAAARDRIRGAVASHHSAALIYGLGLLNKPPDGTVTLTMPPGDRTGPYRRADVIRHTAELPAPHVTTMCGVPVTTAARTAIDIARTAPFMEGVVVADSALHERHASKTDLLRVLAACDRWPGIRQARKVVDFSSPLAESVLESCARVFLHDEGLPPPTLQLNIISHSGHFIARVDFCWPKYRTIAEADGLLKYNEREDAIAELKRDRLLREAGYEVVHFTWRELFGDPGTIAARIWTSFDRAARLARPAP